MMKRRPNGVRLLLSGICMALTLAACGDDSTGPGRAIDPSELEFAAVTGVNLEQMTKTSSGLYWQDVLVGQGDEAVAGGTVTVHYTGWLHNGTQFDSSMGGEPATFNLNGLIAGWQEGIPGMKVGGKRKLVVPPDLGYGKQGYPPIIPQNATLVFDIELIEVQ